MLKTLTFAKEDRALSWYYLLSTLMLTVAAYMAVWAVSNVFLKLLLGILAGLVTARLVVIYHDFEHGAILTRSRLADVIMKGIGILTLTPPSIWDESHEHHHHANAKFSTFVLGSFPTISVSTYKNLARSGQFKYRLIRHPLMIALAYVPIFLISFCLWPFFENPRRYWDCGLAAFVHLALAAMLWFYGGWQLVTFALLVPSFVTFALGGYIFYAQHNFPEVMLSNDERWDYFEAALKSSSFIRMGSLMRWFTANIGYHHIHHVNSRIPFYRLPAAMAAIEEFQTPRCTSLKPREIWKCLQLKLWDESSGRMITMKEIQ